MNVPDAQRPIVILGSGPAILLLELLRQGEEASIGLRFAYTAAEYRDDPVTAIGAIGVREIELKGNPKAAAPELKRQRHDRDDGVVLVVEPHDLAQDIAVARKSLLPEFVTKDDDARSTGPVFFGSETSAEEGSHAGHAKRAGADMRPQHALGIIAA